MSELLSYTWSDFSAGELGLLNPEKFQNGFFNGTNVMVSDEGWVYPRPGLVEITPAGVPSGRVTGMGLGFGVRGLWYFVGKDGYAFDPGGAYGNASIGSLASVPIRPLANNGQFISNYNDKTYDWNGTTLTPLSGSPGGFAVCEWNGFVVVGGTSTNQNRIHFSEQYNPASWPALNYIDIGRMGQISALIPLRDRLIIAFTDGQWWSFTGDPENADAQRVSQLTNTGRRGTSSWTTSAVLDSYGASTTLSGLILPNPYTGFDGANFAPLVDRPLDYAGSPFSLLNAYSDAASNSKTSGANRLDSEPRIGLGHLALARGGGHTVQVEATPVGSPVFSVRRGVPTRHYMRYSLSGIVLDTPSGVYLTTGGAGNSGSTEAPRFFRWDCEQTGPAAFINNMPGDATTSPINGTFTTPVLAMPDGKKMRLHSIDVEYIPAGSSGRTIQAQIRPFGYEGSATRRSVPFMHSAVSTTSTTLAGHSDPAETVVKLYPPESQFYAGDFRRLQFTITISNVVVKSITVHFTALPARS